jgi:hypothetical protein
MGVEGGGHGWIRMTTERIGANSTLSVYKYSKSYTYSYFIVCPLYHLTLTVHVVVSPERVCVSP